MNFGAFVLSSSSIFALGKLLRSRAAASKRAGVISSGLAGFARLSMLGNLEWEGFSTEKAEKTQKSVKKAAA